ncbi:MAG TPA: DUF1566 domain-containing protein [Spirochaetota bacterium]|nr:DUF1566 domain-containing protein [Spirochaetota bacterium]
MKRVINFVFLSFIFFSIIGCSNFIKIDKETYERIFYDKGFYSDGWRYLEAAPKSTEWKIKVWGGNKSTVTKAGVTAIGTGKQNTLDIVTQFGALEPYEGETDYAAKLCNDLESGGHSDWFLPSKDELNLMYVNLKIKGVGEFADDLYWSSSEGSDRVWAQYFANGNQSNYYTKWSHLRVRAVRAF